MSWPASAGFQWGVKYSFGYGILGHLTTLCSPSQGAAVPQESAKWELTRYWVGGSPRAHGLSCAALNESASCPALELLKKSLAPPWGLSLGQKHGLKNKPDTICSAGLSLDICGKKGRAERRKDGRKRGRLGVRREWR